MKKGGTFLLIGLTLAFLGFVAGLLVGRHINQENITIQLPASSATQSSLPTLTQNEETADDGLININTAPAELLDTLPGIGPVLARRIVEYRETNGNFQSISQLTKVEGIGNEKLLAIYELITVGG